MNAFHFYARSKLYTATARNIYPLILLYFTMWNLLTFAEPVAKKKNYITCYFIHPYLLKNLRKWRFDAIIWDAVAMETKKHTTACHYSDAFQYLEWSGVLCAILHVDLKQRNLVFSLFLNKAFVLLLTQNLVYVNICKYGTSESL